MFIFAGSASGGLGEKVAKAVGGTFGRTEISKFTNGEIKLRVMDEKIGAKAVVVQSLSNPTDSNLLEFCLLTDALVRLGVRDIIAVIPWLGYSKQDKVFRPGEPLSVKVVAKMIQVAPIKHLITFDLHNLAILGFFDIPVTNLTARQLFVDYFRKKLTPQTVVVAPDAGAIKASTSFAGDLDVPVVYMDKKRNLATGEVKVLGISRPVTGTDVIIIDDMIVTGGTLVETARYLKKENVKSLSVAATHHLYVPGAEEAIEEAGFDRIVVTDSVSPKSKSGKLEVLSVAEALSQEIVKLDC